MGLTICTILFIVTIIADAFLSTYILITKKDHAGRLLAATLYAAMVVNLSYLISMLSKTYFFASLFSSIYFAFITVTLQLLLRYVLIFTKSIDKKPVRIFMIIVYILGAVDIITLMINPFHEFSVHYIYDATRVAVWEYEYNIYYQIHLFYSYFLVVSVAVMLIHRIAHISRVYAGHYLNILIGVLVVVGMNAFFILLPSNNLFDFSILFYSVVGFYLYWNQFHYARFGMLNEARKVLLNDFGHPIVLFDFENHMALINPEASELFQIDLAKEHPIRLNYFIEHFNFMALDGHLDENYTFHWAHRTEKGIQDVYRCDYKPIFDKRGHIISKSFVLTKNTLDKDILTGFYTHSSFDNHFLQPTSGQYPVSIVVLDLNRLSVINKRLGRVQGDRAIQTLSELMVQEFPTETYFARLSDANLAAVFSNGDREKVDHIINRIENKLSENKNFAITLGIESASYVVQSSETGIIEATNKALDSMKAKKMLDRNTAHSSLLDSLMQIQQENDSTTEAHVQRTRVLGARLARRLGLTDLQISQLMLLCLMHDIGKVGIPLNILNKPGKLTKDEWGIMRSHAERGYRIAAASNELEAISEMILHHHECWDGKGYPDGIRKEAIPLLSRIVAVIDSYDAMTNNRPYRQALTKEFAIEELRRFAGSQYDPYIVAEFVQMLQESEDLAPVIEEEKKEDPSSQTAENYEIMDELLPEIPDFDTANGYDLNEVSYCRYYLNSNEEIVHPDERFTALTGYTNEMIQEAHLKQFDLIFPEEMDDYIKLVQSKKDADTDIYIEHRICRADGTAAYVLCYARAVSNPELPDAVVEILATDVTETNATKRALHEERASSRRALREIRRTARNDSLTELLNREAFQNDTQYLMLNKDKRTMMAMFDVDNFKAYNDTYGHYSGDELLRLMGNTMKHLSRSKEVLACRMGGDEFSMAFIFDNNISDEELRKQIAYVYNTIAEAVSGFSDDVTISCGVALCYSDTTFNELYRHADQMLYKAKENGKNQYFIDWN